MSSTPTIKGLDNRAQKTGSGHVRSAPRQVIKRHLMRKRPGIRSQSYPSPCLIMFSSFRRFPAQTRVTGIVISLKVFLINSTVISMGLSIAPPNRTCPWNHRRSREKTGDDDSDSGGTNKLLANFFVRDGPKNSCSTLKRVSDVQGVHLGHDPPLYRTQNLHLDDHTTR